MPAVPMAEYCVYMRDEVKRSAFWRDCSTELITTFLLVSSNLWMVVLLPGSLISHALAMLMGWAAIGYALENFGGAHMNNAITFAALIRREITLLKALFYWLMQAGGAIAACFFIFSLNPDPSLAGLGHTILPAGVEWWQALVMEAFATCILCLAYLGSSLVDRKGYVVLGSLPTAMAFGLGIFIATPVSGASLSSVRSLGPPVVSTAIYGDNTYWENHWIYWAGPMGGAFIAAILLWLFDSVDAQKTLINSTYDYQSNNNRAFERPLPTVPADLVDRPSGSGWRRPYNTESVRHVNGTSGLARAFTGPAVIVNYM